MDRRDILVLKPDAVICRVRGIEFQRVFLWLKAYPMLDRRLLCQSFLTSIDTIDYAIKVKQRYLKLKDYSEMDNVKLMNTPIRMRKTDAIVVYTCTCGQEITFEWER